MLDLRSIGKRLGSFSVSDLDLIVNEGEYFVLLGPSGVGKTVLIEMIAGLIRPDKGVILWKGRDVTRCSPESRGFAVVYQDCALFPHMTVEANVVYGPKATGWNRDSARKQVAQVAENLGFAHLLERYPGNLSGGEQQRVALGRALVTEPELLLLDEPLSSLDAKTRRQFRSERKRIHADTGITFIHVTHDIEEAISLGSRVGVMLHGRLLQAGAPEALFRTPSDAEVADFLGMRNVLAVSEFKNGLCMVGELQVHAAAADESVSHVWIKPEEIVLSTTPFHSSARNQFEGKVLDWEPSGTLLVIRISCRGVVLAVLATRASFEEMGIEVGKEVYATFKSAAVHCF